MVLKTYVFIPTVQADLIKGACPIKSVSYPALYHGCNSTGVNCPIFLVEVPISRYTTVLKRTNLLIL